MVFSMVNSIHVRHTDWNREVDLIGYRMGGDGPICLHYLEDSDPSR